VLEDRGVLRRNEPFARKRRRVETDGAKGRFDRAGRQELIAVAQHGKSVGRPLGVSSVVTVVLRRPKCSSKVSITASEPA
jgi:hypothetical protein